MRNLRYADIKYFISLCLAVPIFVGNDLKLQFLGQNWTCDQKFENLSTQILDTLITSLHSKFQVDSSRNGDEDRFLLSKSSFEKIATKV